jgi:hypothetical protein
MARLTSAAVKLLRRDNKSNTYSEDGRLQRRQACPQRVRPPEE